MTYTDQDVDALVERTFALFTDMRKMGLPHTLVDKTGDLNDRLLQHKISLKYPVPLKDIDPQLRATLLDLFDRYGMLGVAHSVELMRQPHEFAGMSDNGYRCRWCGQDYRAEGLHQLR